MTKPTLSFVIPAFNAERYLDACMERVLACAAPGDEVIVINDGSRDQTGPLLDAWSCRAGSLLRVVHTENRGVAEARNLGFSMVRTDYVLFLDADDEIQPDVLSQARERGWPPQIDMVEFDYECHDMAGRSWLGPKPPTPPGQVLSRTEDITTHLLERGAFYVWIRLMRVAFLRSLPWQPHPRSGGYQDITAIMLMSLKMQRLLYAGGVLVRYRLHDANFTRTYAARKTLDLAGALTMVSPLADQLLVSPPARVAYDRFVLKTLFWAVQDWVASPDKHLVDPADLLCLCQNSLLDRSDAARRELAAGDRVERKMARHLRWLAHSLTAYLLFRRAGRALRRA